MDRDINDVRLSEGIYLKGKQVKIYIWDEGNRKHLVFDGSKPKYSNEAAKKLAQAANGGVLPYQTKWMTGDYFINKELKGYQLYYVTDPRKFYVGDVWKKLKSKLKKDGEIDPVFIEEVINNHLVEEKNCGNEMRV